MNSRSAALGVGAGVALFAALFHLGYIGLAYASLLAALLLLCFGSGLSLNWQIAIGALLGVGFGAWEGSEVARIEVVGRLFIASLKMLIAPMIFLSITSGISAMAEAKQLGAIGRRTVALYLTTMVFAVAVGLLAVNLVAPGSGGSLLQSEFFRAALAGHEPAVGRDLTEFASGLAQSTLTNPVKAIAEGRILPIVFFSVLFGVAVLQMGAQGRALAEVLATANGAVMKVVGWFIRLAPIGIFALLGHLLARVPLGQLVQHLGAFIAVVFGATAIHAFVTLPTVARVVAGVSPLALLRALRPALVVAFSTSSSAATLPVTTRCVEDELDVPPSVSSFVLPLGATVNMDGTALYEAVAAIFVANLYGIELGLGAQLVVFAMSMAMAIGAPGIPSAGMVTMVVVLEAVGLPVEAVAILISVDRLLDTVRTMANVEGDAVVATCVARGLR